MTVEQILAGEAQLPLDNATVVAQARLVYEKSGVTPGTNVLDVPEKYADKSEDFVRRLSFAREAVMGQGRQKPKQ